MARFAHNELERDRVAAMKGEYRELFGAPTLVERASGAVGLAIAEVQSLRYRFNGGLVQPRSSVTRYRWTDVGAERAPSVHAEARPSVRPERRPSEVETLVEGAQDGAEVGLARKSGGERLRVPHDPGAHHPGASPVVEGAPGPSTGSGRTDARLRSGSTP
jgi:hypothetical protein